MSISTEISRLQAIRSAIRTALISWGVITNPSADFEDCETAISAIQNRGGVSGTISAKNDEYTVQDGYHNGNGKVSISATEQAKLIGANIKSGVTVLGVSGSYSGEGVNLQTKTVIPSDSQQSVTADQGYDALSAVTVEPIPDDYAIITNVTAESEHVLANKVFVDADGLETAGTMVNNGTVTASIDGLTVTEYTIPQGYHGGSGKVSLTNDIEAALAAL